jgi:hypothetical protein
MPLLLRALLALLCALAAAAQVPVPCAGVGEKEKCAGAFSVPCCPGKFLECSSNGRCLYVRGQGRG